jgi:TetR/AcrR family transcriptional regulator, transcriptional repressor for nem operon
VGFELVGSSQAAKAASHTRIVNVASRRIRRDGIDSVAVAELMNEAGLTHGGFYRHFASRDQLVAEAIDVALVEGSQRTYAAAEVGGADAIIDGYLSRSHREKPETGCAVAALPSDIARGNGRARTAYSRQVRRYTELLTGLTPGRDADEAHLILAALVGAVVLARAVNDRCLSDAMLENTRRALHRRLDHLS